MHYMILVHITRAVNPDASILYPVPEFLLQKEDTGPGTDPECSQVKPKNSFMNRWFFAQILFPQLAMGHNPYLQCHQASTLVYTCCGPNHLALPESLSMSYGSGQPPDS